MVCHCVQFEIFQIRQQILGQNKRVHRRIGKGPADAPGCLGNKAHIKIGIVGRQRPVPHKVKKGIQRFGLAGRSLQHFIRDPGQLHDFSRQGPSRRRKRIEGLPHLPVSQDGGSDLYDHVSGLAQTGGLNIKADDLPTEILLNISMDHHPVIHIIDEIGFYAIKNFDILRRMPCLRKGLSHPVVGDGNGPVSPTFCPLYHILGRGQGVHGRHGGVEMKLHPLLLCRILADRLLPHLNSVRFQHHIPGKTVQVEPPLNNKMLPGAHTVNKRLSLLSQKEFIDSDRTGIVGDIEIHHPRISLFQLPMVDRKYVALHDHRAHIQIELGHLHRLSFDLPLAEKELSASAPCRPLPLLGSGGCQIFQGFPAQFFRFTKGRLCSVLRRRGRGGQVGRIRHRRLLPFRRRLRQRDVLKDWGHRRQRLQFQFHPLHAVSHGKDRLDFLSPLLCRQGRTKDPGLDGPAFFIDRRPGDLPMGDGLPQWAHMRKGGKQF